MLKTEILEKYIKTFYGHGNIKSDYWFISLEEWGRNTEEEFNRRLSIWEERGCKALEDCSNFYLALGDKKQWFSDKPKLQATWKMYIRLYLYLIGDEYFERISTAEQREYLRRYQRDQFGKIDGDMCIMELRPLPSPNIREWLYGDQSDLSYLNSRQEYMEHIDTFRMVELKNKIQQNKPKHIFFCSTSLSNRKIWEKIIGIKLLEEVDLGFFHAKDDKTNYYIIEHSTSKTFLKNSVRISGLGNEYFNKIGRYLREIT